MKNVKVWLIITLGVFTTFLSQANDLFSSKEASWDLFGFYGSRDKDGDNSAAGMGAGINYFFTEHIGIGADTYFDAFEVPYLLNGSGIFRFPIKDTRFAPYGFGGFGRQWEHAAQWTAHLGGGVEFRFKQKGSFFADIREVFPDKTRDYTVLRFGFRFKFR